jgi:mono/diheme cytochrome c family protein
VRRARRPESQKEALAGPFAAATRYVLAAMVIIIVLFWALAGLTVFLLAMRRPLARRGGREGDAQLVETRAGRRLFVLGIALLAGAGLAVPTLVLAFNGENKASVATGGLHLNSEQQRGRHLFAEGCAVCHTLAAVKAVGRIGPNLDVRVGEDIPTPPGPTGAAEHTAKARALVESAIAEGRARGLGQMPAGLYVGKEAHEVASFVAAVAGHTE